jgi:glutamate-1-semialdehyde 2,1-aminomutase
MAVAVRIARAYTNRDTVAFCGYHGWADWYLATNLERKNALKDHLLPGLKPSGVPKVLAGTILPFHYNRLDELRAVVRNTKGKLAAIVMEPTHGVLPEAGFLEAVRRVATKIGAVLIFDEITIGWRLAVGGAHMHFGIKPDMAVFAKAISNGYPMAAIIGRKKVMQAAQDTFVSSTYWTEGIGPAAALATIRKMERVNLPKHLLKIGKAVQRTWVRAGEKHGVPVEICEVPQFLTFTFVGKDSRAAKTLFTQEMLARGYLASTIFYPSYAHKAADVQEYSKAFLG